MVSKKVGLKPRGSKEMLRQASEKTRRNAEVKRVSAEKVRERAEGTRKTAANRMRNEGSVPDTLEGARPCFY